MAEPTKAVPDGFHTITPHLVIRGAERAIAFYQKAFGAEVLTRQTTPDGRIIHASIQIGDSRLMLCDEFPEWGNRSPHALGGTPGTLHLSVEDVDTAFDRAIQAGGTEKMRVMDTFWGARYGKLIDPFGHEWSLATQKETLTEEETGRRAAEFFARTPAPKHAKAS